MAKPQLPKQGRVPGHPGPLEHRPPMFPKEGGQGDHPPIPQGVEGHPHPGSPPEQRGLRPGGEHIDPRAEVVEVMAEKNRVRLKTTCTNQDGTVVLDGEALVSPPKAKP